MAVRSFSTTRAKKFSVEATNLKELRLRFSDIAATIGGQRSTQFQVAVKGLNDVFRQVALVIRNAARDRAQASGVPRRLYTGSRPAIFAFSDADAADDKRKRSSLVGVRTGLSTKARDPRLFVTWGKRGTTKRIKDGSAATGGLSMSFGALFERGTRNGRVKAHRYFRGAVFSTKTKALGMLTKAYRDAIDYINRH